MKKLLFLLVLAVLSAPAQTLYNSCPAGPGISIGPTGMTSYYITYSCPDLVAEAVFFNWVWISTVDGSFINSGLCEIDACVGPYAMKLNGVPDLLRRPDWQKKGPEPVPTFFTPIKKP